MRDLNEMIEAMVVARVAEELRKLAAQLEGGGTSAATSAGPTAARGTQRIAVLSAPQKGTPVTHRVRKALASGRKFTFRELLEAVMKEGEVSKFAVRSALGKDRERGNVVFADGKYAMRTQKTPG